MIDEKRYARRDFLRLSALSAGGAVVVACGGGTETGGTTPVAGGPTSAEGGVDAPVAGGTAVPEPATTEVARTGDIGRATAIKGGGDYKEAPMLKAMVDGKKLPPVAERLPKNPYVVPHKWLTEGKYGGTMRMGGQGTDEFATAGFVHESMYGHSILRWLRDGLEIGPGLAESWRPNKDQSEWTLTFREGLKWSDGKPWTTADIMYWWEDMVLNEDHPEGPPDEARSGKGTLMKMTAPNATTIRMKFDAPTPLTPDRLAMWVNRGIGPHWMAPKHYMQQYHPKYNKKVKKDWVTEHDKRVLFRQNPGSPTMTGWVLKSFKTGQNSVWERNPYYWCVDRAGNQLPYIDGIAFTPYQDPEVMKLNFQQGKVDFVNGGHTPLSLADVAGLKKSQAQSGLDVRFWDGGDGTASSFFLNLDYSDPKLRKLFREPKFRQALSHAYNRAEVQKAVYFQTGELTTGTMSPKAIEFNINAEGKKVYQQWRDSYVKHDPERAKKLLDEIGVVDKNGDGMRELPDGGKLVITLDYGADTGKHHVSKNTLMSKGWKAIGIDARLNPVPPSGREDRWAAGKLMSNADWGIGDGPNCLVFPQWLVPLERQRWAPLQGVFYGVRGTPKAKQELDKDPYKRTPPRMDAEKGGAVDRLWKIYDRSKVETDPMKRHRLVWDMIKIHVSDGPFVIGTVANTPTIVLVKKGLKNVPTHADLKKYGLGGFTGPWIIPTPAVYDPETFYWDDPAAHG